MPQGERAQVSRGLRAGWALAGACPRPHSQACTLFFLLVGAGGLISFCKIRRHMRVMFSTTTGVLMFTAMRKRLSAGRGRQGGGTVPNVPRQPLCDHPRAASLASQAPRRAAFLSLAGCQPDIPQTHHSASGAPSSCPPWRWSLSATAFRTEGYLPGGPTGRDVRRGGSAGSVPDKGAHPCSGPETQS